MSDPLAVLREQLAVCECSYDGGSGHLDEGVHRWVCLTCRRRYEDPPRIDRKVVFDLLSVVEAARESAKQKCVLCLAGTPHDCPHKALAAALAKLEEA